MHRRWLVALVLSGLSASTSLRLTCKHHRSGVNGRCGGIALLNGAEEDAVPAAGRKWTGKTRACLLVRNDADVLFDAYADLSRMPQWSPLVEAVVEEPTVIEGPRRSSWTLRVPVPLKAISRALGFGDLRVGWGAVIVAEERPHLLAWQSTSGLPNAGRVTFDEVGPGVCNMSVSISYTLPERARALVQTRAAQSFVRRTLERTMRRFAAAMSSEVALTECDSLQEATQPRQRPAAADGQPHGARQRSHHGGGAGTPAAASRRQAKDATHT